MTSSSSSFIIAGCRTPIGKFLGGLASVPAPELGAVVVRESLRRAGIAPDSIDEVILGCVLTAGVGQAPARQAALKGGLAPWIGALTINKVCGSGLKAVMLADQVIRAGDARAIAAGGMENMSRSPHLLMGVREGWKFGDHRTIDSLQHDGLWCATEDVAMGHEADFIATSRNVSREDQDALALESHRRAVAAQVAGHFDAEIVPVKVKARQGEVTVSKDEGPRADSTAEALAKLRPAFNSDGTVTAGNASQISDGAAAVIVASEAIAATASGETIKARIVATATSGVRPKELFIAPVSAIESVLDKAKLTVADLDLIELNEAFAAQGLACMRPLRLDPAKTNISGGAIALGHPIGASGARTLVTLLYNLKRLNLKTGLTALCLGGGNAVAMIVERV